MVQCDNTNNDVGNGGDVQWSMVNGINCCSIFTSWYSVTMCWERCLVKHYEFDIEYSLRDIV